MATMSTSGRKDDAQTIRYDGDGWVINGGKGADTISGSGNNITFLYAAGDGNDSIVGFNATSTLRISNGTSNVSSVKSGNDVIVTVGSDKITLVGAASLSTVNIITGDKSVVVFEPPGYLNESLQFFESLQEAVNAVVANDNYQNGKITLLKDATGTLNIPNVENNKWINLNINLEGNTFTATNTIALGGNKNINVNINGKNGGTITSTNTFSTLIEVGGGRVNLSNLTLDATKLASGGYIANVTGGNLEINGTVNSNNGTIRNAGGQLNISTRQSDTVNADILLSGSTLPSGNSLNFNGGTINGNLFIDSAALNAGVISTIYLGDRSTFTKNAALTGDNFINMVANKVSGSSDTYSLALPNDPNNSSYVASLIVNGAITYYTSLQDAMNAAAQSTTNGTLTLLKDCTGTLDFSNFVHKAGTFSMSHYSSDGNGSGGRSGGNGKYTNGFNGRSITHWSGRFVFDLNGHTLTATNTVKFGSEAWVIIRNGNITTSGTISKLFEINGGELDLQAVNLDATKVSNYIATNSDGGVLNFENDTAVDSNYATIKSTDGQLRIGNSINTTIKANILLSSESPDSNVIPFDFGGGKIDGKLLLDSAALNTDILNGEIDNQGGGDFKNFKIFISNEAVFTNYPALTEENLGSFVANTNSDGTYTVNLAGLGDIGDNVAYFNGAYYKTLQAAITAAQSNDGRGTILLLKDCTDSLDFSNFSNINNVDHFDDGGGEWSEPSSFIVNLNGHTLTANDSIKLGSEARILIKNGTLTSTNTVSTLIANNGNLTLNNTTVDATKLKSGGFIATNGAGTLSLENGTAVNSNNGTIKNVGGSIELRQTDTIKANILLSGSTSFNYSLLNLEDATIDGDLLLDSAAAANARILNSKIFVWNGSFTKNAAITEENIGKLIAYDTDGDGTYQVKAGNEYAINTIENNESNVTVSGTVNDDDIFSNESNVTIDSGDGNDYVNIGEEFWGEDEDLENISVKTGAGDDTVYNNSKNATISTGAGNDSIGNHGGRHDGVNKNTLIDAGDGDDTIENHGGNNVTMNGGIGNDSIYNGNDDYASISGGEGSDSIENSGSHVTIDGGADNDYISNNNDEDNNHYVSINGGAGADTIYNHDGNNVTISGGTGNDTIINSGNNVLIKYTNGDGNDVIEGFSENSTLSISGGTYSTTKSGNDIIVTVGQGKITLKGAANLSSININDSVSTSTGNGSTGQNISNTESNKTLNGGAGSDTIYNNALNVTIYAGTGDDSIGNHGGQHDGVNKNTLIDAGDGDDTIENHGGNNVTMNGGLGNDSIYNGNDDYASISGGEGSDSIENLGAHVTIDGGAGADSIFNYGGNNVTISGGTGNDSICNSGNNVLFKYANGDGNDLIEGFSATSTLSITGGSYSTTKSGNDFIVIVGQGKITLKGAASLSAIHINDTVFAGTGGTSGTGSTSSVKGTEGNDNISNTLSGVTINALGGKDTIYNNAMNVTIYAGAGNDSIGNHGGRHDGVNKNTLIDAGDGNDTIENHGGNNVTMNGGIGNDSIYNGNDDYASISGGEGADSIENLGAHVTIDGGADNDFLSNNNDEVNNHYVSINGGAGADSIFNYGGNNVTISGGLGNDSIYNSGNNVLFQYANGDGNDTISGFSATSTLSISGGSYSKVVSGDDVIVTVGDGSITLTGAASLDTLNIIGSKNSLPAGLSLEGDTLKVYSAFTGKTIDLSEFEDATAVDASAFTKALTIVGDKLDNTIRGGTGNDTLTGGSGADTFVISGGKDIITDYTAANDKISVDGAANVSIDKYGDTSITVGKNSLVLKKLADETPLTNGKQITFTDGNGATTKTYFNDRIILSDKATLTSAFKGTFDAANFTAVDASSVKSSISIIGNAGANTLVSGTGNDTINGGAGQNLLTGGTGKDIFIYGGGNDTITDYDPADKISLGSASVQSFSVTNNDVTFNLSGSKTLTLKDAAGKKVTFADGKNSTINIYTADGIINSAETAVTLNAATKSFTAGAKLVTIYGSNTSGVAITGNDKANLILDGAGSDTLTGGKGNDIFIYGGGNDTITDYDPADKISLGSAQVQSFSVTDKDVTFNLGDNKSLTLKDAAGKKVTFADGKKSTVNIYTADGIMNPVETAITLNADMKTFTAGEKLATIDASNTSGIVVTGNVKANMFIGGNGSDTFVYTTGAGNDTIDNYGAGDKISVSGATITEASVNKNGHTSLKVGRNAITVKNSSEVTIVDDGGEKIFSNGIFYNTGKTVATLPVNFSAKGTTLFDAQTIDASLVSKAVNISGNDVANSILGSAKNDTLNGGTGNNTLTGGKGNDIFVYGGGNDTITDYDPADKISLGSAQIQGFSARDKDVTFNLGDNKSLTLKDAAGKKITFADGKKSTVNIYTTDGVLNSAETAITLNAAIKTFEADSKLVTINGSNTSGVAITGNVKGNMLFGGSGSDTFVYEMGAGNDTIDNYGASDKFSLVSATITDASINKNGSAVLKVGKNSVTVKNSSEVTIVDEGGEKVFSNGIFYNTGKTVATLPVSFSSKGTTQFNSQTIDASLVSKAVNISGNDAANSILGSAKNDTLNGGTGNNTLTGGAGVDIFVYGGGNDTITDYDPADKISLGSAQIQGFSATDKDVTFNLSGSKTLTLKDAAGKKVTFADGKKSTVNVYTTDGILNSAETAITLNAAIKTFTADSNLVTIDGSNTSELVITGNDKANVFTGGKGNDSLLGNTGNDKLYGNAGNDTLVGGAGNDSLWGQAGADTFIYNDGDGKDIIFGFDDDDMLQITGEFTASYSTKTKAVAFKVGTTASAITLKDFTATTFNVNGNDYTIIDNKFVKK